MNEVIVRVNLKRELKFFVFFSVLALISLGLLYLNPGINTAITFGLCVGFNIHVGIGYLIARNKVR